MTTDLTYSGTLVPQTCWCGIRHAIPAELNREMNNNPRTNAYCPLGHSYVVGKGEAERLRATLAGLSRKDADV